MKILNVQYTPIKLTNKPQNNTQKVQFSGNFNPFSICNQFDNEQFKIKFANDLKKAKDEIYAYLDESEININGKSATIIEHLKDMFLNSSEEYWEGVIMHNSEHAAEIVKNGFDFSRIKKTVYGPGMYFSTHKDELGMYLGQTVYSDFKGRILYAKNIRQYGQINCKIESLIKQYLKIDDNSPTIISEHEVIEKFIHEYTRNHIVKTLGIDGAYNDEGQYFIVFNPNSISNIHI